MLIIADENIPYVREAFSGVGEVRTLSGRAMGPDDVRDAQVLLVRSVTKVNEALLGDSQVRFVGTATIGTDHVDQEWLAKAGIRFTAAPGSNANSVSEYITAALLVLARREGVSLAGRSLGIIGVGNVGSRVEAKARALGMEVVLNDPPLARETGDAKYRPVEELLGCDAITLHVPLEKGGSDPTWHLADAAFLSAMKPTAWLMNSSRGAVADNGAVLDGLNAGRLRQAVLDVWEGEPAIRMDVLDKTALATQHIAGYSFDGKVNGTVMLYEAACEFLGQTPCWRAIDHMPRPEHETITLDATEGTLEDVLRKAVLTVYPIERDDADLRATANLPAPEQAGAFDRLRKEYPRRREFQNTRIILQNGASETGAAVHNALVGLGFCIG
jgi:erythronate-4-phosphate dehydrogenase